MATFGRRSAICAGGRGGRPFGQHADPLGAGGHRPDFRGSAAAMRTAGAGLGAMATGKDGGVGRAVDLGQCHQHRRFYRPKPGARDRPLGKRLEFERVGCDIGHVERRQRLHGCRAVVVGRAADKAEAGERDQRVDGRAVRPLKYASSPAGHPGPLRRRERRPGPWLRRPRSRRRNAPGHRQAHRTAGSAGRLSPSHRRGAAGRHGWW